jgi:metal-responsive CopG/Arc/MetJ family transcriptional regulator
MAVKKFAISIPEEVMARVDEAAAEWGITRSRFISNVLKRVALARSDAQITRRLNEVFGDPEIAREQKATSRALLRARRETGTAW